MKAVVFTRQAAADLAGHLAYVASEFSAAAAEAFVMSVDEALAVLSTFPMAGRKVLERRKFPVPGTPLIFIYRIAPSEVQITRCFDGRENWGGKRPH